MNKEERKLSLEEATRDKHLGTLEEQKKTKKKTVRDGYDFIEEIDKQIVDLYAKDVEPQVICVRSYGYSALRHAIKKDGQVIKLGDSGKYKLSYKGLLIVNISHDKEETTINLGKLNWIAVYGN